MFTGYANIFIMNCKGHKIAARNWWRGFLTAAAACLLLWLWSACSQCERLSRRCPPVASRTDSIHIHDTIMREVYIRDTIQVVRLVPEYIYVMAQAGDTAYAETAYARAMAWLCGGNVCLNMWNKDSAAVLVKQIEVLEQRLRETSRVSESVEVKTERYIPWFVRVLAWAGGLLIAYHVGKVFIKVVIRYLRV